MMNFLKGSRLTLEVITSNSVKYWKKLRGGVNLPLKFLLEKSLIIVKKAKNNLKTTTKFQIYMIKFRMRKFTSW